MEERIGTGAAHSAVDEHRTRVFQHLCTTFPAPDQRTCPYLSSVVEGAFDTYYQVIRSLSDGSVCGYEVLNRPRNLPAEAFYSEVLRCGCGTPLDLVLLRHTLSLAKSLPHRLFVNLYSSSIESLDQFSFDKDQVVFELSEREKVEDIAELRDRVRRQGVELALDDVGAGFAGLNWLVGMMPQYVKLNRGLISEIDASGDKQDLVRLFVQYGRGRFDIIAEGIETEAEATMLRKLGVNYGQGYLLGRPASQMMPPEPMQTA